MPLENRLQALETILDSQSQKKLIERAKLKTALKLARSIQRSLYGKHYVRERSLRRYLTGNPRDEPSRQNYAKYRRQKLLENTGKLTVE